MGILEGEKEKEIKMQKVRGFTKAEIIGLINERIQTMATDEDGWAKPEREIAQAELKMLIRRIEGRKLISELRREVQSKTPHQTNENY